MLVLAFDSLSQRSNRVVAELSRNKDSYCQRSKPSLLSNNAAQKVTKPAEITCLKVMVPDNDTTTFHCIVKLRLRSCQTRYRSGCHPFFQRQTSRSLKEGLHCWGSRSRSFGTWLAGCREKGAAFLNERKCFSQSGELFSSAHTTVIVFKTRSAERSE